MKRLLISFAASLLVLPAFAAQIDFYLSIDGGPAERVNSVTVGTLFQPGQNGATGSMYYTLSIGDLNGDGHADLMASVNEMVRGTGGPHGYLIVETDDAGRVLGKLNFAAPWLYRVRMPSTAEVNTTGQGMELVFASSVAPQGDLPTSQGSRHRGVPSVSDITCDIAGVQTEDVFDINGLDLTFSAPSSTGSAPPDREGSVPSVSEIVVTKPADPEDGVSKWFRSTVLSNGGDERKMELHYTSPSGRVGTWVLTVRVQRVDMARVMTPQHAGKSIHIVYTGVESWSWG